MDVQTMIGQLGLRLEDADKVKFTDALKLDALNNAQLKVANFLHNAYLTELQVLKEDVTATAGKVEMTVANLDYGVLKGAEGILKVRIKDGLYCNMIDLDDLKRTENAYLAGTLQNPLAWVFQNHIYVSNGQTNPAIDVYFLKIPSTLRYKFTSDQADDGASDVLFDGLEGEGLSAVNDTYNGAVIYNITKGSYHVVTDYDGTKLMFTVEPAAAANFAEEEEMYFITHSFDLINLVGIECDLNEALIELVLEMAESACWSMDEKASRSADVEKKALGVIAVLNERYAPRAGIGTRGER